MKVEDAFYYENLLKLGIKDAYDAWINEYLESEEPLSDIVLELASCLSDINGTISVLHHYCLEKPFDETIVCDRLRIFLYYVNRMNKEEIVYYMYRVILVNLELLICNYGEACII